jgi:hypothetical protein
MELITSGGAPIGKSPDGVGAYLYQDDEDVGRPMTRHMSHVPTTHYEVNGGRPVGAELEFLEPDDTSSGAALHSAGFTALLAALGIGVGVMLGGGWGAGAGLMIAGAGANAYRGQKWMNDADPARRHEAVVSATIAVFEVGIGGYLAYKAYKSKKA